MHRCLLWCGLSVMLWSAGTVAADTQREVSDQELKRFTRRGYSNAVAGQLFLQEMAAAVYLLDQKERPGCNPVLVKVKPVGRNDKGEITERWTLKGCSAVVHYYVMFSRKVEKKKIYLDYRVSTERE